MREKPSKQTGNYKTTRPVQSQLTDSLALQGTAKELLFSHLFLLIFSDVSSYSFILLYSFFMSLYDSMIPNLQYALARQDIQFTATIQHQ